MEMFCICTVQYGSQLASCGLFLFSRSVMSASLRPHGLVAYQVSLSLTISQSLLKFMSIGLGMLSNHLILLSPPSPFAFNLSQNQGLFQ